jgi:hypothetical protein
VILVPAPSEPEVENALDVCRFYEHLHDCAKQCRYVISRALARGERGKERYVRGPKFYPYSR